MQGSRRKLPPWLLIPLTGALLAAPGQLSAAAQELHQEDLTAILQAAGVGDSADPALQQSLVMREMLRDGFAYSKSPSRSVAEAIRFSESLRQPHWLEEMERRAALASLSESSRRVETGVAYDIPMVEHPLVDVYIDLFTGRGRWYFKRWLARVDRYAPIMQPILAEKGVPLDTIYLAMIESGFVARALSSASAGGFWQFIPSTGRMFDLRQDIWVDERSDFVKATESAADYLLQLHKYFGDWHLAWASYNAGQGRVSRAMKRYRVDNFWELIKHKKSLAKETQHYVPKVIAAAIISKNREAYGFTNIPPEPPLLFDTIEVDAPVDLKLVAEQTGTSVTDLRVLNPALRYDITPPGTRYNLRVEAGDGDKVRTWMASLPPTERISYRQHVVRRGETLSHIAGRFGSSVRAICALNGVRNPRRLKPGHRLVIPTLATGKGESSSRKSSKVATRKSSPRKQTKKVKRAVAKPASAAARSADRPRATHVVASGDTLWSIAKRYGVGVPRLKQWNARRSNQLSVGDVLKIF